MYHMCPWPFWLKPKLAHDKISVIHVFQVHKPPKADFKQIFWKTNGLQLWQLELHLFLYKLSFVLQNQMMLKMLKLPDNIKLIDNYLILQLNNGYKIMHKK